ncbi:hypothetical protein AXF42_Ash002104 [Apostasia shenzhenica]|uniref:FLZ-type domain-containing protein n=1 Tax=Apostasia shenzhenica TaxID=1088818 RepID=A0A2I0AML2_9ASPA|nr:hypothetical protein AXF42_Ash002104 [Apostasia shenzhenica]
MSSSGKESKKPSLLPSLRLLLAFSSKGFSEIKPFSVIRRICTKRHWSNEEDSRAIGLGILGALANGRSDKRSFHPDRRIVLFGSKLKIKVPRVEPSSNSPTGSVDSIEFSVSNKNLLLALHSPACLRIEESPPPPPPPPEAKLSEDYTCVISHGSKPKKTHIFENCVVQSFCEDEFVVLRKETKSSGVDFLSCCHACKRALAQGIDIYMYRGALAFCSSECREQMMCDGEDAEKCFEGILDHF